MNKFIYLFLLHCVFLYDVKCQLNLPEGSSCAANGKEGKCVMYKRCLSLIQDRNDGKKPEICSYIKKRPVICCTDCDLVEDIDKIVIDPMVGFRYKDGSKSRDYCLNSYQALPYLCKKHFSYELKRDWNETRQCHNIRYTAVGAAGGEDAERGEFPHMVPSFDVDSISSYRLHEYNVKKCGRVAWQMFLALGNLCKLDLRTEALLGYGVDSETEWLCGGSLISDQFILTAAHCSSSSTLGPVTYAALGILKRSDPENLWQKYKIQEIIIHPSYKSPSKYHDIAMLRTDKRVKFSPDVLPACLNSRKTIHSEESWAYAMGWGALGNRRPLADTLQKVVIQKFTPEECSSLYPPHRHLVGGYDHSTQMCYGDRADIKDTCTGDSGGPLVTSSGCMYDITGVTSYGRACGFAGQAGMYTRVRSYVPWIESIVWP